MLCKSSASKYFDGIRHWVTRIRSLLRKLSFSWYGVSIKNILKMIFFLVFELQKCCFLQFSMFSVLYSISWIFLCFPYRGKFATLINSNSNPVSYWVTWNLVNTELFTQTGQTVFTIFCFQKMFKITKLLVPKCFINIIYLSEQHY